MNYGLSQYYIKITEAMIAPNKANFVKSRMNILMNNYASYSKSHNY